MWIQQGSVNNTFSKTLRKTPSLSRGYRDITYGMEESVKFESLIIVLNVAIKLFRHLILWFEFVSHISVVLRFDHFCNNVHLFLKISILCVIFSKQIWGPPKQCFSTRCLWLPWHHL